MSERDRDQAKCPTCGRPNRRPASRLSSVWDYCKDSWHEADYGPFKASRHDVAQKRNPPDLTMNVKGAETQAREPQAMSWLMAKCPCQNYPQSLVADLLEAYAASLRERNAQLERQLNGRDCDLCGNELPPDKPEKWRSCAECYEKLQRECERLRSECYKGIFVGQVFDCPALSVVEEGCICKSGWGHKSFAVLPNSLSDIIKAEAALRGAQKGAIHPHCMGTEFPKQEK